MDYAVCDWFPDAVLVLSDDFKVIYVNEIAPEILRMQSKRQIKNKSVVNFLPGIEGLLQKSDSSHMKFNEFTISLREGLKPFTLSLGVQKMSEGYLLHAKDVSVEVSLHKKYDRVKEEVDTAVEEKLIDPLTGLYNRHVFEEKIDPIWQLLRGVGNQMCAIAIDVDDFKKINDSYGHKVGDMYLKHISNILMEVVRGEDFAIRSGGDEFLVILTNASDNTGFKVADRLIKRFQSTPVYLHDEAIPVSVSIGVAALRSTDSSWEDMVERADQASYVAKNNGKNRLETFEDPIAA